MTTILPRSTACFGTTIPTAPIAPLAAVAGSDARVACASGRVRYANLDYAASAPALQTVVDEITAALPRYASVHRGAGQLSQETTAAYEDARRSVARFVGARDDDTVVFTRNTTDSINLLATCVPGDTVVLDVEHHANLLPWKRTGARIVECAQTVAATLTALDRELAARPAALLAITGASNVTGEVLPLPTLATIAHRHGARLFVDAAQLAPHRAVTIADHGIDYLAFSGHKLYAPFGAGVLVGRTDWLDGAEPYLAGGGASADVPREIADDDVDTRWHHGPARHEAGSPNVLGALAVAAACDALIEWGPERIRRHEQSLLARLDAGLGRLPGVRPLRIWSDSHDHVGIAAFTVDGWTPRAVAEHLSDGHGIGVRDGRFCAHPLLSRLGHPDGAVRVSLGLGSRSEDIDRLLTALAEL
ncbi:aminotransferase class V-fold PLP-dependent enzyme [Williamsia sterculiae]|uniref:Selenocysteine lyase/Cysteine desulfurase n=1 Tax=Williamsia sterculiae TaxID=1344003 RepID=A0A1N7CR14_9NOCA|nr:aminotransferase class V-fold PLP-dependent enzyme [Williamsia sterculiae]SIR65937.1 Selenocysteine lyase/Cysteine desulfurase [Williamsia sterculiae]